MRRVRSPNLGMVVTVVVVLFLVQQLTVPLVGDSTLSTSRPAELGASDAQKARSGAGSDKATITAAVRIAFTRLSKQLASSWSCYWGVGRCGDGRWGIGGRGDGSGSVRGHGNGVGIAPIHATAGRDDRLCDSLALERARGVIERATSLKTIVAKVIATIRTTIGRKGGW